MKTSLLPDPIDQFALWFEAAHDEIDRTAMTLATVNKNYAISARMVLLKSFDQAGFVFFTHYDSPKAQALQDIPHAALVFWWPKSQRQVRITGQVNFLDAKASDLYFASRSRESQIGALASKQSTVIPNRDYLLQKFNSLSQDLEGQPIPRPANWGGYVLTPQSIEFWEGKPHRLHDRFLYTRQQDSWQIVQLSP